MNRSVINRQKALGGVFVAVCTALSWLWLQQGETQSPQLRWYKGNTHVHTELCGHADTSPAAVTAWYHDRGYNFLCLSEHNKFIDPATVQMPENKRTDFILIPGEEVTGAKTVHTTALNIDSLVDWKFKHEDTSAVIQNHVDGTHKSKGIPILNHPNFHYAVGASAIQPVKRLHLFELYNGHPHVHNEGDKDHPGTEELWDTLLTSGMMIYGVSSDDAHHFQKWGKTQSNPGRGWIMVRADKLTPNAITEAIHRGDFYASSGVILSDVKITKNSYQIEVDEEATARELTSTILHGRHIETGDPGFHIDFIGPGGKVLKSVPEAGAEFPINPTHTYVRCKITFRRKVEDGLEEFAAWTQPAFTDDRVEKARAEMTAHAARSGTGK